MNKVHIVVDSTANVPAMALEAYSNLHVVQIKVILGELVADEAELAAGKIFKAVREKGIYAKTSQPAPGEFAALFEKIIVQGDSIVVVTVSAGVSGTWQCASSVASQFPKGRVQVVDSQSAGLGLWNLARQGLELAGQGKSADEISRALTAAVSRNDIYILPDTLEYLHKGGRIGGAAALFGSLLQIKPILTVVDGKVAVLDKVRTRCKALFRIIEQLPPAEVIEWLGVTHTEAPQRVEEIVKQIEHKTGIGKIEVAELGSSLAAHFGPGCIVVMLQRR